MRVVCVDASTNPLWGPSDLIEGGIYTVARLVPYLLEAQPGIELIEVRSKSLSGFWHTRFRPAVDRKIDISELQALLVPGAKIRETV